MTDLRFNLNGRCRVRLTDRGRARWHEYWRGGMDHRVDADGWLREQLWEVAAVFGCRLHNGMAQDMETGIILEVEP